MTDPLETARSRWSGRVAVVTGAAGGLGAAFSDVLRGLGATVVTSDLRGCDVVTDVRDHAAVEALAEDVYRTHGDVALLINNAGVESVGLPWEQDPEVWHRVVDVNLNGVYHGVRAFVPRMLAAGTDATVFNLASVGALTTGGRNAVYQVTKHGVLALSESMADGLAGTNVQVSVALPGPVRTRIYEDAEAAGGADDHLEGLRTLLADEGMPPEEGAARMLADVAAGRFAVTTHPDWLRRLADQRADRLRALPDT